MNNEFNQKTVSIIELIVRIAQASPQNVSSFRTIDGRGYFLLMSRHSSRLLAAGRRFLSLSRSVSGTLRSRKWPSKMMRYCFQLSDDKATGLRKNQEIFASENGIREQEKSIVVTYVCLKNAQDITRSFCCLDPWYMTTGPGSGRRYDSRRQLLHHTVGSVLGEERTLLSSSFGVLTDRQPCLDVLLMAPVHYLVMFVTKFNYSYLFFTARSHLHPRSRPCPAPVYDFQLGQKMQKQKLNVKKWN